MTLSIHRRTKADQAAVTRARLLSAARHMFAERGFARTATEDIVAAAEVTRGALYHHFPDKAALFEAVFMGVQVEIGERIEAASARHPDIWSQIVAGCLAFLHAASAPDVRQIVLRDGPAVLGAEAWRQADERHATFRLRQALGDLNEVSDTDPVDIEPMTALINGALNEAAHWIAEATDGTVALERAEAAVMRLFSTLTPLPRDHLKPRGDAASTTKGARTAGKPSAPLFVQRPS